MASERSPLLNDAEGLTGSNREPDDSAKSRFFRNQRIREVALFVWALIATAGVIVLAVFVQHKQQSGHSPTRNPKRNLIFMVSDGMGPASLSLTRSYRQHVEGLPINDTLSLDRHFWGTSRTRSSSSLVTDSAAGATAFSCARKSYNGAISVTPDFLPCGSVMEAAKRAGYTTGMVVTTSLTDATPATFASHALFRAEEDSIAGQEVGEGVLGRVVDLMLGGGRCHFLPNSTEGSCRLDNTDIVKIATEKHGWGYTDNRSGFDMLDMGNKVDLPFLGLFAPYNFPFEIDRQKQNDVYPSLSEMAKTALRALDKASKYNDEGFFLMIEGSRIDHAGHFNDPAAQVREVLEYDRAFRAVLDFIEDSDIETVLVATSDHETGGLATALQEPGHLPVYDWYPQALQDASSSCEFLAAKILEHTQSSGNRNDKLKSWINKNIIISGLGIKDATDAELSLLASEPETALNALTAMISLRAHVGWSTHGHTAVDVNVYSSGNVPEVNSIRGNIENTQVGDFLRDWLRVDVEHVTDVLKKKMKMPHDLLSVEHVKEQVAELDGRLR